MILLVEGDKHYSNRPTILSEAAPPICLGLEIGILQDQLQREVMQLTCSVKDS
jgi:hypothetical protein